MFRIELYFTLVCTSTFKYFIDFVYRNQWPLGDILDKKLSYAIVLALLPRQLSSSAIFTCMTGCVNAWKMIAWNCSVVCLLRVLIMQFQNFMTNHIIFILCWFLIGLRRLRTRNAAVYNALVMQFSICMTKGLFTWR